MEILKHILIINMFVIMQACCQNTLQSDFVQSDSSIINPPKTDSHIDKLILKEGQTIQTRIKTPEGYKRPNLSENSFQKYLRELPLKAHNSTVKCYDGSEKTNNNIYDAVVDLKIGNKDLHQCADAIMRLRAEYLWREKKYDSIHFNFTNGFRVDFNEWLKGKSMVIKGNSTYWSNGTIQRQNTYEEFWNFMELIFTYAGTLSLSKEMVRIELKDINIGDVFIKGGTPGHAVIVVDLAMDSNGNKIFLLAQSYMPAQEIQILKNPNDSILSPWYTSDSSYYIYTPEWSFNIDQLMRFKN